MVPVIFLTAGLAGVHWVVPGLVEFVAGMGGLVISVFVAADGEAGVLVLDEGGISVVLVFGSLMMVSGLIRLLGSGSPREMARHLVVATAALEIGLFTVEPVSRTVSRDQAMFTVPVVLMIILLTTTLVGIRSRNGFPLLGTGLTLALGWQVLSHSTSGVSPVVGLAGSLTFAAVAWFLGRADEDLTPGLWPGDLTPHRV